MCVHSLMLQYFYIAFNVQMNPSSLPYKASPFFLSFVLSSSAYDKTNEFFSTSTAVLILYWVKFNNFCCTFFDTKKAEHDSLINNFPATPSFQKIFFHALRCCVFKFLFFSPTELSTFSALIVLKVLNAYQRISRC